MMKNKTFLSLLVSVFILCLLPVAHAQKSGDISIEFGASQLSNVKSAFSGKQSPITSALVSTTPSTPFQAIHRVTTVTDERASNSSAAAARSMNGFKLEVNYYLFDNLAFGYGYNAYSQTASIKIDSIGATTRVTAFTDSPTPFGINRYNTRLNTYNTVTLPNHIAADKTNQANIALLTPNYTAWEARRDADLAANPPIAGGGPSHAHRAWLLINAPPPQPPNPLVKPTPPTRPTTSTVRRGAPAPPTGGSTAPTGTGKFTINSKFTSHSFYSRLFLPLGLYAQAGVSLRDWTEKATFYKVTWPPMAINLGAGGQWMLTDTFSLNAGLNMHVGGKPKIKVNSAAATQIGLYPTSVKKTAENNLAKTGTLYEFSLGFGMTL